MNPQFTHRRAKVAGAARHSPKTYALSIARRWDEMTEDQRAEVRQILAPIQSEKESN